MNRNTFCFYFYIKKTKLLKNGEVPIRLRIRVNGLSVESQIKRSVPVNLWDQDRCISLGRDKKSREINEYLDMLRLKILTIHRELELQDKEFSARLIMDRLYGKSKVYETLLAVFDKHNELCTKLIGKGYNKSTVSRYKTCRKYFAEMLQDRYNIEDIALPNLSRQHISSYEHFLLSDKDCCHNTTVHYLRCLKKITNLCLANEWMTKDPFRGIRLRAKAQERETLTINEIKTIWNYSFESRRLEQVRDVFILGCFTWLAYSDLKSLSEFSIDEDEHGEMWIRKQRRKTGKLFSVPLLDIPLKIINKYSRMNVGTGQIKMELPVLSNQKMNSYLKEISQECNIQKPITTHLARHTFASLALQNGVSIENLAHMLGHSDLKMTTQYARIPDDNIIRDIHKLAQNIR